MKDTRGKRHRDSDDFTEADLLLNSDRYQEPVWRQYTATLVASLISMATGCTGGWSAAAVPLLMDGLATDLGGIRAVTADEASWITSLLNLGCLVGSLPAGYLSHQYGRRKFLLWLGVLIIVGWLLIIYNFNNVGLIYAGRFIVGFVAGAVCIALAMYSNEVCSDPIRGRSGAFYDMMQVFGILFVYIVTATNNLYWASILCMMVPVLFLCTFYWMPESPMYLIKHGRKEEAIECIRWFHGEYCDLEKQLSRRYLALLEGKDIDLEETHDSSYYITSVRRFFATMSKTTMKTFILVLLLFIIQRSCGAPIIVYYTVDVFQDAHSSISSTAATIYSGVAQFICTAMSVTLVDYIGRRVLLIASFGIMVTSLFVFLIYLHVVLLAGSTLEAEFGWIPVLTISTFVGVFRLGAGPIPWFMCAELIPTEAQRWALPTILFIAWGVAFLCSKTYLGAVDQFGYNTVFTFFIVICVLGLLETIFLLPETKNKSRSEIQQELSSTKNKLAESENYTQKTMIIIEN